MTNKNNILFCFCLNLCRTLKSFQISEKSIIYQKPPKLFQSYKLIIVHPIITIFKYSKIA